MSGILRRRLMAGEENVPPILEGTWGELTMSPTAGSARVASLSLNGLHGYFINYYSSGPIIGLYLVDFINAKNATNTAYVSSRITYSDTAPNRSGFYRDFVGEGGGFIYINTPMTAQGSTMTSFSVATNRWANGYPGAWDMYGIYTRYSSYYYISQDLRTFTTQTSVKSPTSDSGTYMKNTELHNGKIYSARNGRMYIMDYSTATSSNVVFTDTYDYVQEKVVYIDNIAFFCATSSSGAHVIAFDIATSTFYTVYTETEVYKNTNNVYSNMNVDVYDGYLVIAYATGSELRMRVLELSPDGFKAVYTEKVKDLTVTSSQRCSIDSFSINLDTGYGLLGYTVWSTTSSVYGSGTLGRKSTNVGLPDDYQAVTCLQSSGTQYINTGVKGVNINSVLLDAQIVTVDSGGYKGLFGATGTSAQSYPRFYIDYNTSNGWCVGWGSGNAYKTGGIGTQDTTRHIFELKADNTAAFLLDGTAKISNQAMTTKPDLDCYLFAANDWSGGSQSILYTKIKVYSCQIFRSDYKLIRNFIPAIRKSDNKPGLYDLITKEFYTNQGTGEFTYTA